MAEGHDGDILQVTARMADGQGSTGGVENDVEGSEDEIGVRLSVDDQQWVMETAEVIEMPVEIILEVFLAADLNKDRAFDTLLGYRFDSSDNDDDDQSDRVWRPNKR